MDKNQILAVSSMTLTVILYNITVFNNFKINKKLDKILN